MALLVGAFRVDYKYFDMKIEVFKEFGADSLRLFDAINPDRVTWLFGSENHRDGPTDAYRRQPYQNDLAPLPEDLPGTIKFDGNAVGDQRLISTQKNVVIDYTKPVLRSYTGVFTSFRTEEHGHSGRHGSYDYETRGTWQLEMILQDDSGIDNGAYELTANGHTIAKLSRKTGEHTVMSGVSVEFEQSSVDSTMFRVTIEIDPTDPEVKEVLLSCTDQFDYIVLGYKFYDIAGNELDEELERAFTLYKATKDEMLEDVQRLKLDFVDTNPANLFVDRDTIGKTTISVYDPNEKLKSYGFDVRIGLLDGSVGYLSGSIEPPETPPKDNPPGIWTQNVDGIDSSGYVKAYAYLDGTLGEVKCYLSDKEIVVMMDPDLATEIRSLTYVEGELGRFIVECDSNKRKLNVDPFIPGVLKNEEIYGLCKLVERELNTMYTPMSGDCRIGILEKIHRISQFKNPDECEMELLPRFAEEHGSELAFTYEQVEKAAKVIQKYAQNKNLNTRDLVDSIYRRYFMILPYIDRWKGTKRSFELLYRVLGIDAEIEPLWEGPDGQMVYEDKAKPDYRLTAHLALILNAARYSNRDIRELSDFAMVAVKSILPVNRVLSEVNIVDVTKGEGDVKLTSIDLSREERDVKDEKIYFKYEWTKQSYRPDKMIASCGELYLPLPMYPSETIVGHTLDSTREWPIPDNCCFYFSRYADMLKTYDSVPLKIAFLSGDTQMIEVDLEASGIILEGDRIFVKCKNSRENTVQMSKFNTNILASAGTIGYGFAFSRLVKNYCKPLSYTEFKNMDTSQTPYDPERQNG